MIIIIFRGVRANIAGFCCFLVDCTLTHAHCNTSTFHHTRPLRLFLRTFSWLEHFSSGYSCSVLFAYSPSCLDSPHCNSLLSRTGTYCYTRIIFADVLSYATLSGLSCVVIHGLVLACMSCMVNTTVCIHPRHTYY